MGGEEVVYFVIIQRGGGDGVGKPLRLQIVRNFFPSGMGEHFHWRDVRY